MKKITSGFGKKGLIKSAVALFALVAMLVPTVAQASILEHGISNIVNVENNSGSTAGERLNLGGESHKVDISVKERSTTINLLGKPRLTGVVMIPAELQGLVKSGGKATLNGEVSVGEFDIDGFLAEEGGDHPLKTILDILDEIDKFDEEVLKKGVNLNVNLIEIRDTLDLRNGLQNLGKGSFDMGEVKISEDGTYAYVDSQLGAADYIAKSINNILDNLAEALKVAKITSTNLGDFPNMTEAVANAALEELKVELLGINESNSGLIQNAKDASTGIGGMITSVASVSLDGTTEVVFPLEIQDPLYHAKDANGNRIFLPNNVEELDYEQLQDLTNKQTQYDAKFVGAFDRADRVNYHIDIADYISEHLQDLYGNKTYTVVYYGFANTLGHRVAGPDRYATAAEVSKRAYDTNETVVLVNGENYVDVAPATVLAAKEEAPVLLTRANAMPAETKAEIERLGAKKVIVVGGQDSVADAILKDYSVERLTGADRFETAANVAERIGYKGNVVLVNSEKASDALVMTSVGIKNNAPILFVEENSAPAATINAVKDMNVETAYVGGGENSIGNGALNGLGVKNNPIRVAGDDRYATAVAAAKLAYPETKYAVVTDGVGFIDALVAAPYAAIQEAPVVLVRPDAVPPATSAYVSGLDKITVVGGPNSVAETVLNQLVELTK